MSTREVKAAAILRQYREEQAHARAELIAVAMTVLDNSAPTATGATMMLPDGEVLHLDADHARAMAGTGANEKGGAA